MGKRLYFFAADRDNRQLVGQQWTFAHRHFRWNSANEYGQLHRSSDVGGGKWGKFRKILQIDVIHQRTVVR
jgi:hypothetical protein